MTGSRSSSRRRELVRQIGLCRRCKQERLGVTTFEGQAWRDRPAGHPIHFCDDCDFDLIMGVGERPLEEVLREYLG